MDTLRLILLFLGLAIIVGIYWRFREPKQDRDESASVDKPSFGSRFKGLFQGDTAADDAVEDRLIGPEISDEDVDSFGNISVQRSEVFTEELSEGMHIDWDSMTPVDVNDEVIIAYHILAKGDALFTGEQIRLAAEQSGFRYGDMDIFHYFGDTHADDSLAVCSLVNLFKPGYFDLNDASAFTTAGISLFMQLPGPMEAREAFKVTLAKAHALAEQLDAELCDEKRSILTEQTIGHLKDKVEAFRFKQQIAAMKHRQHER